MDSEFTWIPFYMEFADKLREYKDRRSELVELINKVFENARFENPNINLPKLEKDRKVFDIDPFTVFGLFNKGIADAKRITIAAEFKNVLGISAEVPSDFDGIPVMPPIQSAFYGWSDHRKADDIDNLWDFYISALDYADNETGREEFCRLFNIVIKQFCVGLSSLTMGLFWVRPYKFLNLDGVNQEFLRNAENLPKQVTKFINDKMIKRKNYAPAPDGGIYLQVCELCLSELQASEFEYKNFPSLSHYAWLLSKKDDDKTNDNSWYPSPETYTPGLSVEDWTGLLKDSAVFNQDSLTIIQNFLDIGGEATCKELSERFGKSVNYYNRGLSSLSKRVYNKTNCPLPPNEKGSAWWPIVCFQKKKDNSTNGIWLIKLRNELQIAYKSIYYSKTENMLYDKYDFLSDVFITEKEYDKLCSLLLRKQNIILQGAPGVGKTYSAKKLAYSIIGEENKERVCMVQFHQSYSYEDFIFGYRPTEKGGFEPRSGVFYDFCKKCRNDTNNKYFFIIDEINRGNLSKIFGELLMLIEADKRGEENSINLVYGGEAFYIPTNLYIIGLMNTADRSLAMIDYALRRRFSFYTMKPAFENADNNGFSYYTTHVECDLYFRTIEKIKDLNREIRRDTSLGKGFEIGHSYFAPQNTDVINYEWVCGVIEYDIIPLIEEYWFDDDKTADKWITEFRSLIAGE